VRRVVEPGADREPVEARLPRGCDHEAIYQALFIQDRGALTRELVACLRT
jgi:hypothetical protein